MCELFAILGLKVNNRDVGAVESFWIDYGKQGRAQVGNRNIR
jgi:hypothetical protein